MNAEQATTYLQALAASLTVQVLVPGLMLAAMCGLFLWVLWRAQQREDFDASQFLRDDAGKLSTSRLFAFVACGWSTWHLAVLTFNAGVSEEKFLVYLGTWSGSLVALRAIEAWAPSRPVSPPPPPKE